MAGLPGYAMAHALPADQPLPKQVAHQLFSPHHLPLLILLAVAGVIIYRITMRRSD